MKRNNIYYICVMGLMCALCFLGANLRINIPLPIGETMIHFGNVFMLVSGMLLGGFKGGLVSGLGMSLFDLFSGTFAVYAPGTFIVKFLAGFVCGYLYNKKFYENKKMKIFAPIIGIFVNIIGSPINTIIVKTVVNNGELKPILLSAVGDLGFSILNGVIAVLIAYPIMILLQKSLMKTNFIHKM